MFPTEYKLSCWFQSTTVATSHAQRHSGTVDYIYETALKGYAIELPNEAAKIAISKMPRVRWVEENALGKSDQAPASPQPSPPWGLDSLDSSLPAPTPDANGRTMGFYGFAANGTGVSAYVVDSGINTAHIEFNTPARAVEAADCFTFELRLKTNERFCRGIVPSYCQAKLENTKKV